MRAGWLLTLLLGSTACLLTGCAEDGAFHQIKHDAEKEAALARVAAAPAPFIDTRSVQVVPGVYLGAEARPIGNDRLLPPQWQHRKVAFIQSKPLELRDIANMVTQETNMPVSYSLSQLKGAVNGVNGRNGLQPGGADLTRRVNAPAQSPLPATFTSSDAEALGTVSAGLSPSSSDVLPQNKMRVNYNGTLSGFLDLVAANYNMTWSSDGERITFSNIQTKIFDVPALPIVLKLSNTFNSSSGGDQGGSSSGGSSNSSSGGSTGGTSQEQVSATAAVEVWKEINTTLKTIVGSDGGGVDVSGVSGTVAVTGRPETVARVGAYIREINRRLSKEVTMSMTIYSVILDRQDNYDVDVVAALTKSGALAGTASPNGLALAQTIIGGAAAATTTTTGTTASSGLSNLISGPGNVAGGYYSKSAGVGGGAIVKALSTIGNVSVVNSQSLTTVNGIPVPYQNINLRGYVSNVSTTALTSGSSTSSSSINQSTIRTGYVVYLTPHVNNDGTVLLSYALDMSELAGAVNGFDTYTTGGQTVQLPNVNSRTVQQEAVIPAGNTLVVSGIELTRSTSTRSGTGSPEVPIFGGQRDGGTHRELLVIAITPEIIDLGEGRTSNR